MDTSWGSFLGVLPPWMREQVDALGAGSLRQLRLRLGKRPALELLDRVWRLDRPVADKDLEYCVNTASGYSPWSVASAREGFLTIAGGHRMGVCGETVTEGARVTGFRRISSLCLRVARDIRGIAPAESADLGSVLILGAPGWGKTTLLRDLCRCLAGGAAVAVVDSRGELFPQGFQTGEGLDVLSGCEKEIGITMVLRTMAPDYIAVDEITAEADARALVRAGGCGVKLLATAHGSALEDLARRPCYRLLLEAGVFQTVVLLNERKTYRLERMEPWSTNGSVQFWSSAAAADLVSP